MWILDLANGKTTPTTPTSGRSRKRGVGDHKGPANLHVDAGGWQASLLRAARTRHRDIPRVLVALAYELHILVKHAAPEERGRFLLDPCADDPDEAAVRSDILANIRAGLPWLQRMLAEAERCARADDDQLRMPDTG
jgi:hypothetical protein